MQGPADTACCYLVFLRLLRCPGTSHEQLPELQEARAELVCVCVSPQRPSPDVKAELFELLFRTLHHNWRYFFKSSVLASVQRGIAEEQMENEPQFSAIMQVRWKSQ